MLQQAEERNLISGEHFTVDRTLLEAWASVKSFQRRDGKAPAPPDDPGNATLDFHGENRSNETHESKTDPDAKLAPKVRHRAIFNVGWVFSFAAAAYNLVRLRNLAIEAT